MRIEMTSALDCYNLGTLARQNGDFAGTIAGFDACLNASPHPRLESLAWYNLSEVIFLNFDFKNRSPRSISDVEYSWSLRAEEGLSRAITGYNRALRLPMEGEPRIVQILTEDSEGAFHAAHQLKKFFSVYNSTAQNCGKKEFHLTPVKCFAAYDARRRITARGGRPRVRFDGVYISKLPVDFGMPEKDQPYSYLRFYEDGAVIQADIPGIPPAPAVNSFDKINCRYKGNYQIQGTILRCLFPVSAESSGSGKASTVEDEGEIVGDELHLHHVSYINNFYYDEQYAFSPFLWSKYSHS